MNQKQLICIIPMHVDPQVVLVGNSLPALNDVTAMELPDIVAEAAKVRLRTHRSHKFVTLSALNCHYTP